jgi:alginate O-acetyltransferase complex protein AlgI
MVFSSPVFLFLFLPLVLAIYFVAPRAARNGVLLVASLVFYAWGEPRFVAVMLASIMGNYVLGIAVEHARPGLRRRLVVAATVVLNIGLLGFYKYGNFVLENVNALRGALAPGARPLVHAPIALPLGISFFTFHALSYVIDVYRGHARAQRRPLRIALYISFFPQLVAGPIVRYHEIADQLVERRVTLSTFAAGAERFMLGMAKKMLVANVVAVPADALFGLDPSTLTTPAAWIGVLCYTLQIYFDFSGYSDMAIGLAALFGFRFPENFDYPYVSQSLTEFWRRWHISLSRWFRDYLYIPLGGNRGSKLRTYVNLVTIFFLCGLWHGASWAFVVWGLYHGAFLVLERMGLGKALERVPRALRHGYAIVVFMVGWVFFRASSLPHAATFLRAMAGRAAGARAPIDLTLYVDREVLLAIVVGVLASAPVLPAIRAWLSRAPLGRTSAWLLAGDVVRVAAFALLFVASAMRLSAGTYNPFIYFRF